MAVFGIADLHLHTQIPEKDMSVFGPLWKNHEEKLRENWEKTVGPGDVVLIPGDISWAMKLKDAEADLDFVSSLPGTKIMVRGNHELWWHRKQTERLRKSLPADMILLQGNAVNIGGFWFAGTRGWRHEEKTRNSDPRIWQRELDYLEAGINAMGEGKKIVLMHYPPYDDDMKHNDFARLLWRSGVDMVVYGHIHGGEFLEGNINGVEYRFVAADRLGFAPLRLYD
ncbi:MAG: metallophosphoesterase [Abditibacteriota bacterium]|nr:metallophosphoesterase [Abditibacteriota bacterium]